jgi:TPR repeat protein
MRAAEQGSSDAEKDLSQLYLLGAPGVPADRHEAMRWLAVSAGHGNVEAMSTLGYMSLTTPMGVPSSERNVAQGFCWLMRAALLQDAQAQEKLSFLYAQGEPSDALANSVPIDLVQADLWFRLAARSPFHDNSQIRAMIEPKMTTEQLGEAKRLSGAWQASTVPALRTTKIALPTPMPEGTPPRLCPAMT